MPPQIDLNMTSSPLMNIPLMDPQVMLHYLEVVIDIPNFKEIIEGLKEILKLVYSGDPPARCVRNR